VDIASSSSDIDTDEERDAESFRNNETSSDHDTHEPTESHIDHTKNDPPSDTDSLHNHHIGDKTLDNACLHDLSKEISSDDNNHNNDTNNTKHFKYVAAVRKKAEREVLPGRECDHCKKFYDAIHGDGNDQVDRKKMVNDCSRHKHLYSPPPTPPHYWDVGWEENTEDNT